MKSKHKLTYKQRTERRKLSYVIQHQNLCDRGDYMRATRGARRIKRNK